MIIDMNGADNEEDGAKDDENEGGDVRSQGTYVSFLKLFYLRVKCY